MLLPHTWVQASHYNEEGQKNQTQLCGIIYTFVLHQLYTSTGLLKRIFCLGSIYEHKRN